MIKVAKKKGMNQLRAPDDYYSYYYAPNAFNPNNVNGANLGEDFNL